MTLVKRLLALGAVAIASAAIASPSFAHDSDGDGDIGTSGHDHAVTYCRDSSERPGEGDVLTTSQEVSGGWHECEPGEADGYREARAQRQQREADARQAQDQKLRADIDREQSESDELEEQTRLCQKQPTRAGCNPVSSSVTQAKPAPRKPAPPKPAAFVVAQQERVSRNGNPAGVGVRPVTDPQETGFEDAVDVPDLQQFALETDPTDGRGPRNLVWFSFVAMAAIASLGYGLWRVLFVEGT